MWTQRGPLQNWDEQEQDLLLATPSGAAPPPLPPPLSLSLTLTLCLLGPASGPPTRTAHRSFSPITESGPDHSPCGSDPDMLFHTGLLHQSCDDQPGTAEGVGSDGFKKITHIHTHSQVCVTEQLVFGGFKSLKAI